MTWSPHVPPDFRGEAAKIRYEIVPYVRGSGLDVGCGPFKAFAHSIGVDGQQHPGPRGPQLVMDCSRLPKFSDGAFDYVFSSHLLEHIEDYRATLKDWFRLVRPGGYLILYLPHRDLYPRIGTFGSNPDHKHDFSPTDITEAMLECGGWHQVRDEVRAGGYEYSFLQVYRKRLDDKQILAQVPGPQLQDRTACVIRPGAYGDALQASAAIEGLAEDGYLVTVVTEKQGEEILRNDPHVHEIIVLDALPDAEWTGYWDWLEKKFDRFVNLTESVEKNNIATATDLRFYWNDDARRAVFGGNYGDRIRDVAGVSFSTGRFYETATERALVKSWADARQPLAVIAVSGSTPPKFWPWVVPLTWALAQRGWHVALLGDMRALKMDPTERISVIGTTWPMREALALAKRATVVIGQETAILNAVAFEPMRKVVLLSHSTVENLTRDWINTVSLHGNVPCYPCHRIHVAQLGGKFCTKDADTGGAACQAAIGVEDVLGAVPVLQQQPEVVA